MWKLTDGDFSYMFPITNNTLVCESPSIYIEALPNMHTEMFVELVGPSYGTVAGTIEERSGSLKYRFAVSTGFPVGTHTVTVTPPTNAVEGKLVGSFIIQSQTDDACKSNNFIIPP
jgi:hypothetical protein